MASCSRIAILMMGQCYEESGDRLRRRGMVSRREGFLCESKVGEGVGSPAVEEGRD